jgi:ech hydrogenase subunit C
MSYITKSPWVIHYDGSSCNGCDIEVLACLTPMYDVERFGIINTGNPKHADIFLITGAINEQNISVVKQIYEQMPEPKVVAAIGICATSGGIFKDCYNIMGGVDTVIPVDVYIPGCAARPEAIIDGVVAALGALEEKKKAMEARPAETSATLAAAAADSDGFELPDGAPPKPPEDPVLPGDDVEVKYYGAAPEGEETEAGNGKEEA